MGLSVMKQRLFGRRINSLNIDAVKVICLIGRKLHKEPVNVAWKKRKKNNWNRDTFCPAISIYVRIDFHYGKLQGISFLLIYVRNVTDEK